MTQQRTWHAHLGEPETLSDLLRAARDCMAQVCSCSPEVVCLHAENRMTPVAFVEWIEQEVHRAQPARQPLMLRQLHADRALERRGGRRLRAVPA